MEHTVLSYVQRVKVEEHSHKREKQAKTPERIDGNTGNKARAPNNKHFQSKQFNNYDDYLSKTYSRPKIRKSSQIHTSESKEYPSTEIGVHNPYVEQLQSKVRSQEHSLKVHKQYLRKKEITHTKQLEVFSLVLNYVQQESGAEKQKRKALKNAVRLQERKLANLQQDNEELRSLNGKLFSKVSILKEKLKSQKEYFMAKISLGGKPVATLDTGWTNEKHRHEDHKDSVLQHRISNLFASLDEEQPQQASRSIPTPSEISLPVSKEHESSFRKEDGSHSIRERDINRTPTKTKALTSSEKQAVEPRATDKTILEPTSTLHKKPEKETNKPNPPKSRKLERSDSVRCNSKDDIRDLSKRAPIDSLSSIKLAVSPPQPFGTHSEPQNNHPSKQPAQHTAPPSQPVDSVDTSKFTPKPVESIRPVHPPPTVVPPQVNEVPRIAISRNASVPSTPPPPPPPPQVLSTPVELPLSNHHVGHEASLVVKNVQTINVEERKDIQTTPTEEKEPQNDTIATPPAPTPPPPPPTPRDEHPEKEKVTAPRKSRSGSASMLDHIKSMDVNSQKRLEAIEQHRQARMTKTTSDPMNSIFVEIRKLTPDSPSRLRAMQQAEQVNYL